MKLTKDQKKEIQEQQSQKNLTKRVTSQELEKILYEALVVGQRMCNDYYSNNNYNNYNGDHSRSVTDSSHNNHHNEIEKGDKHVITAASVKEATI